MREALSAEEEKIDLTKMQKVEAIMKITKKLLSNLIKNSTTMPKSEQAMDRYILNVIRKFTSSNDLSQEYKDDNIRKQTIFWIFELLKAKNIFLIDQAAEEQFKINKIQIVEYLSIIENEFEACKEEVLQMKFLD